MRSRPTRLGCAAEVGTTATRAALIVLELAACGGAPHGPLQSPSGAAFDAEATAEVRRYLREVISDANAGQCDDMPGPMLDVDRIDVRALAPDPVLRPGELPYEVRARVTSTRECERPHPLDPFCTEPGGPTHVLDGTLVFRVDGATARLVLPHGMSGWSDAGIPLQTGAFGGSSCGHDISPFEPRAIPSPGAIAGARRRTGS